MLTGLCKTLGHLWLVIKGPHKVYRTRATGAIPMHTVCSENLIDGYQVKIRSECISYRVRYQRWWILDAYTTLYYVSGQLIKPTTAGQTERKLEPLLVKVPWLRRICPCTSAHYYAINAYIDTVEFNLRAMCSIAA